jgi:hypothetical protein
LLLSAANCVLLAAWFCFKHSMQFGLFADMSLPLDPSKRRIILLHGATLKHKPHMGTIFDTQLLCAAAALIRTICQVVSIQWCRRPSI